MIVSPNGVPGRGRRRRRLAVALAVAASATLVAAGGVAGAGVTGDADIRGAVRGAIAGSYIVKLKATGAMRATAVDATADRLAAAYGGAVTFRYHAALKGYAVKGLSEAQARRLAADRGVDYVQRDAPVRLADTQEGAPWGLDRVDQRDLPLNERYTYGDTARNVHAYILDSGIRVTHRDFGGRATSGFDAVDGGAADDCNGHGTHVAGTVGGSTYGVAKEVRLVAVRVLDCVGDGTIAGVVAGVDWVTANAVKPAIANMSLGGLANAAVDDAVRASIAAGVTYAVAAGNADADACESSPARTPEAITVGATTRTDARGEEDGETYSNYGPCLDIFAPGTAITSASHVDDTLTADRTGTSMAAPHVAGVAALLASANPAWTPQQIRDAIVADATPGKVTNPGEGSPNVLLHVGSAEPDPPSTPTPTPATGDR